MADLDNILRALERHGNLRNVAGMARYGINTKRAFGVSMPYLRATAKKLGRNHALATQLWGSGVHEARILASLIDEPSAVTERQMDAWARGFDSWDLCDQCCANLFEKTRFAYRKAAEWGGAGKEFVRRAGFVMMARLAVSDKNAPDEPFERFLGMVEHGSDDPRNFVRKAVNWALRQIGKRNAKLNRRAIGCARRISRRGTASARWIASDALRELSGPAMLKRLERRRVKRS